MATRSGISADRTGLYTPEQRLRRDGTRWTLVQGVLAPLQFFAFAISVGLVLRYLLTGDGYLAAVVSIFIKTSLLLAIMVTGAIWEKVVFGRYLFAPAFFWEDAVSMLVIALHVGYVLIWWLDWVPPQQQLFLALAAYLAYVINAGQFLWKFRLARIAETGSDQTVVANAEVAL